MRIYQNEKRAYLLEAAYAVAACILAAALSQASFAVKSYYFVAVLAILSALSIHYFGFRRDKHYLRAYVSRLIVSCVMFTVIVCFALGLLLNYTHSSFPVSLSDVASGLLPVALVSIGTELFRYTLFNTHYHKTIVVVIFTTVTTIMNVALVTNASSFAGAEAMFITICSCVLPIAATESLCSYLCLNVGLQPALVYKLCARLYLYVLPILPNLGIFLYAVVSIALPAAIFLFAYNLRPIDHKSQKRAARRNRIIVAAPFVVALLVVVSLVSGLFRRQIIAIASDSMTPTFARGDAVIVEKTAADAIKEGDILVFKHEGVIITHRVIQIDNKNGAHEFTTQGDANEAADRFKTSDTQVIGRVVHINKYIGFPTVWLNELFKTER